MPAGDQEERLARFLSSSLVECMNKYSFDLFLILLISFCLTPHGENKSRDRVNKLNNTRVFKMRENALLSTSCLSR